MEFLNNYYINKSNLLNNVAVIRKHLKPATKICAVVKANAYGVGMKEVVGIIRDYVDYYAVANINEALELREMDNEKEILVLGYVELKHLRCAIENNIGITVISKGYWDNVISYLKTENIQGLKVHIKINTGLNRFGLNEKEFEDCMKLFTDEVVNVVGCYTHFATKGDDRKFVEKQYNKFKHITQKLNDKVIRHCANSYAALNEQDKQLNMVRVGFNLYGMEENEFGLKPVVSIESKIINILNLRAGETVGYNRTFKANRDMKIAVIPIGYADGFSRNLSNNFSIFVNGKFAQVVGRVCMDICFVDVSDMQVAVGTKVEIMGEKISTTKYSNILNTSPYEILLNFNKIRANKIIVM